MATIYEIDPEADVLLLVPRPTAAFAPWLPSYGKTDGISSPSDVAIKASSRHLSLASKPFRTRLSYLDASGPDGRTHLTLDGGFDPSAVKIALDAVHGRGRRVPRSVDVDTLAKIALFVDKYQLVDAVDVYADRWFDEVERRGLPQRYGRDLVLLIYASYVFRREEVFGQVTKTAITTGTGALRTLGLPIREGISRAIETERKQVLSQALNELHATIDDLRDSSLSCSYNCDIFTLGSLLKALPRSALISNDPTAAGVTVSGLADAVRSIPEPDVPTSLPPHIGDQSPTRKRKTPHVNGVARNGPLTPESSPEPSFRSSLFDVHRCSARQVKLPDLDSLERGVKGLKLESGLGYYLY